MSFSPLKVGGWAFGEILTSAQMNQLNTDFPFAIDGRSGGTYTPSSSLSIIVPTTKALRFNDLVCNSPADGGLVSTEFGLVVGTTLQVSSSVTAATIVASAGCQVGRRIQIQAANADATVQWGGAGRDLFILPAGVWSTTRNLTLSHTSATSGLSEMEVINQSLTEQITVVDPTLGTIDTVPVAPDAQHPKSRRFIFVGTTWQILN